MRTATTKALALNRLYQALGMVDHGALARALGRAQVAQSSENSWSWPGVGTDRLYQALGMVDRGALPDR